MPTSVGPNMSADSNLVFGYDFGDTSNCYFGPPTTNIVSNPFNIAGLSSAATVIKTNNTNINYNGQLTAATISGSGWMAYTAGGLVSGSNMLDIGKSSNTSVGQGWSTSGLSGSLPIAKVYNRILTPEEIYNNYNELKTRFNLA